jgi:release factor glutamine methyltransferase
MSRHPAGSVGFLIDAAAKAFTDAGIDTPRLDARLLVAHGLGRDPGWLIGHPEAMPAPDQARDIEALVSRRAAREPLAYITGEKEFWSLPFMVTPATLIPRPDSETLVETVLERVPDRGRALRVLDLGTGSGCLLLALLHELPGAAGVGIDRSAEALEVAMENARALGFAARARFMQGHWLEPLSGEAPFDVVVTNPPYVSDAEMAALAPEILGFEPETALRAGADGLDDYREILVGLAGRLAPGGLFCGEIGERQGAAAAELARQAGLECVHIQADAAGRARCIYGHAPEA